MSVKSFVLDALFGKEWEPERPNWLTFSQRRRSRFFCHHGWWGHEYNYRVSSIAASVRVPMPAGRITIKFRSTDPTSFEWTNPVAVYNRLMAEAKTQ
jgi:hypothetical protein